MALNMEAQYAKALQIGKTPQGFALLKQAALGQNDDFDQVVANMALKQLTKTKTAVQGQQAAQQLAGKQTVAQKNVAAADQALPEMSGIGQLSAPNMEALAAAEGGIMSYADGGEVERYADQGLVLPEGYELFEDPTSGEVYPRKKRAGLYDWGLGLQEKAQGIKPPPQVPDMGAQRQAAPAAPAAAAGDNRIKAPEGVKKALATVSQPKQPVEDPSKAEVANLDKTLASTEKLYDFLDKKFGDQLSPIKDQLAKDREEYKNMKSENVGLALLGAAGALLKPGRSTASAIGEGLGTLAEYGSKFQPQLLAARQGISAGEIGLAQAQAQAARGNFGTAAQLVGQDQARALQERELAAKEPLYKAQAGYYGAAAGAKSGAGGLTTSMQLKVQQQASKAWEDYLKSNINAVKTPAAREAFIAEETNRILKGLGYGGGANLNAGFIGGKDVTGKTYRSSLFEE